MIDSTVLVKSAILQAVNDVEKEREINSFLDGAVSIVEAIANCDHLTPAAANATVQGCKLYIDIWRKVNA